MHNLEGFGICQACLNVHALKIFKGFCHTRKALAERPFLRAPRAALGDLDFSAAVGVTALSRGASSLFTPEHSFSHAGPQDFAV